MPLRLQGCWHRDGAGFRPLGHKVGRRGLISTLTRNLARAVLRSMSRPCRRRNSIALQHDGEASEIADFVAYLLSPSAGVIPSASTAVDGACAV
jgi:hypothetical protein